LAVLQVFGQHVCYKLQERVLPTPIGIVAVHPEGKNEIHRGTAQTIIEYFQSFGVAINYSKSNKLGLYCSFLLSRADNVLGNSGINRAV
jgi:hypothetical protein